MPRLEEEGLSSSILYAVEAILGQSRPVTRLDHPILVQIVFCNVAFCKNFMALGVLALSSRNVQRFRGGLGFTAHRLVYHSTPGSREIKKGGEVGRWNLKGRVLRLEQEG